MAGRRRAEAAAEDIPPHAAEAEALASGGGELMGVLKLADVTKDRKVSNWRNESALCSVSRGRMLGIPTDKPMPSPCWGISLRLGAEEDPEMTAVEKR